jgi:hypothetical protein
VGEPLDEWTQKNADLTQRAQAGEDQAFLDLIRRDPRVLGSLLTVAKVISWRTELEVFAWANRGHDLPTPVTSSR